MAPGSELGVKFFFIYHPKQCDTVRTMKDFGHSAPLPRSNGKGVDKRLEPIDHTQPAMEERVSPEVDMQS